MNKKSIIGLIVMAAISVCMTFGIDAYKDSQPKVTTLEFETPKSAVEGENYNFEAELFEPNDGKSVHPVVIIAHGYNSTMDNCEDVATAYTQAGYAAIVFDFVGGSRNSSTQVHSSEMTTFTEVTDYEIVLDYVLESDSFDHDNVFISGQSFGGLIATVVAEKNQDRINSVVLFYPAYNMVDNSGKVLEAGVTEDMKSSDEVSENLYSWDGLLVSERYLTELNSLDITGIIGNLNKDVIIMQGDLDTDVTLESTQEFLQYFPSARLVIITGGSHGFWGEQLEQACNESIEFLNTHLK